ncbi:56kDa selenium binding family protein [Mycobacterium xenopi 4042]|uniref:56kDa selenium binding family protein n=1 Tax=Mycobacterium xenopi 4042 TaxID=1299334 RepID=X8C9J5_MYCXE|nr:56kDa selenium binding family protein [Mycobacterium xenopi 4042]
MDCDPSSSSYGGVVGWANSLRRQRTAPLRVERMLERAVPRRPRPHHQLERRYLVVPGIRSSHTFVLDTKPDPLHPTLTHTIDADELAAKAGIRARTRCIAGRRHLHVRARRADGNDGPGASR